MKAIFLTCILHALTLIGRAQAQGSSGPIWLANLAAYPTLSNFTALFRQYATVFENFTDVITIIAPNDNAFSQFFNTSTGAAFSSEPGLAQALLSYHLINNEFISYDLKADVAQFVASTLTLGTYTNVTGGQRFQAILDAIPGTAVPSTSGTVISGLLQNATIFNLTVYDGLEIYISDKVLALPQKMSDTAIALNLTASVGALTDVNVLDNLNTIKDLTILMPNNAAFQSIAGNLANLTSEQLLSIMEYHTIVGQVLYSSNLTNGLSIQTQLGTNVVVSNISNTIYFNNARVVVPDVLIGNGVIHVIEDVLNPGNTTAQPGEQAFASAISLSSVPFTSGVATPTSKVTAGTQSSTSTSSAGSSPPFTSSGGSGSHTGAIAGGVVGGVVGLAAVVLLIWCIRRRHSTEKSRTGTKTNSTAISGGINRNETVKSFHKAELEATTKAYQKPELEGSNPAYTKQANVHAVSSPASMMRSELPGTISPEVQPEKAAIAAPLQSQQESAGSARETAPTQQQQSRTGQDEAHEAELAHLNNQRRLAQIEHQRRMAELEHEQRMAELDLTASRLRSRNTAAAELDAESSRTAG